MRYLKGYSLLLIASLVACSKSSTTTTYVGNWVKRSEFEGVARSGAASFVIDNKAYVGTGYDGENRLQDFWAYDVDLNQWTQKAPFIGSARNGAVGMTIGSKGYVGTGYDGRDKLKDFYEYDATTNSWAQKADFAGTARYGAVGFGLKNNLGYISTGYDGNWLKDNWEYNPATNSWQQAQSLTSGKRTDASVFVIGNRAYVCMGTANSTFVNDFYVFDGDSKNWTQLNYIDNVSDSSFDDSYNFKGSGAASFAMNGKGYIVSGTKGSLSTAVWEYDPNTDRWTQKTDFEGAARTGACGFSIKERGFVVLGVSNNMPLDDMREFHPFEEYNKND
ncbi:Kelch repeat-containing protein [Chitinophaga silvatica]|nr:kelch repeat-containing protein [Chitinophaga silvatica]